MSRKVNADDSQMSTQGSLKLTLGPNGHLCHDCYSVQKEVSVAKVEGNINLFTKKNTNLEETLAELSFNVTSRVCSITESMIF